MGSPDVKKILDQALAGLESQLEPEEFQRWLRPLKYRSGTDRNIRIQVPNIFFKKWITDRYLHKIRAAVCDLCGRDVTLELVCGPTQVSAGETSTKAPVESISGDQPPLVSSGINEKYTFSNFVVGASNQLAHAASLAVANATAVYNPLFIYGGSGLGKTHILNAIGNHLLKNNPKMTVAYRTSEQFTNELIEALRSEHMSDFRQKYRSIDALFIDDIHFIGGKERTQEEFFYTFNSLYEADKQIVLSSDKMPKDIPDLEDRLRSRFEGGLFADIAPPDQETKVAILSRKAEEEGIPLSNEVAFYLASQQETNIRVLEGYLARLGAYASLHNAPVELDMAQKILGMFIEADQKLITVDHILKVAASFFNVKVADLKSAKKQKAVAAPRQAAMYMARQLTHMSTIEIGQRFGGRDHSTVIHAVKKVTTRMQQDHSFTRTIQELERTIRDSVTRPDYSQAG